MSDSTLLPPLSLKDIFFLVLIFPYSRYWQAESWNKIGKNNKNILSDYSTGVLCDRKCSCVTNGPDFLLASFPLQRSCLLPQPFFFFFKLLEASNFPGKKKKIFARSKGSKSYKDQGLQSSPPSIPFSLPGPWVTSYLPPLCSKHVSSRSFCFGEGREYANHIYSI